jgi:hypothetical protein
MRAGEKKNRRKRNLRSTLMLHHALPRRACRRAS